MSHLTMCHDIACPSARSCQRSPESGTKPNPDGIHQSWTQGVRMFDTDQRCDYFIPKPSYDQIQRRAVRCNTCQRFVTHEKEHKETCR
jgi:hypothetical protein